MDAEQAKNEFVAAWKAFDSADKIIHKAINDASSRGELILGFGTMAEWPEYERTRDAFYAKAKTFAMALTDA